jgi:hypothetical protein
MRAAGTPGAAYEVHEQLPDISRRPRAKTTGALQHGMAALKCVVREVSDSLETIGLIIDRLPFSGASRHHPAQTLGFCLTAGGGIFRRAVIPDARRQSRSQLWCRPLASICFGGDPIAE